MNCVASAPAVPPFQEGDFVRLCDPTTGTLIADVPVIPTGSVTSTATGVSNLTVANLKYTVGIRNDLEAEWLDCTVDKIPVSRRPIPETATPHQMEQTRRTCSIGCLTIKTLAS